MSPSIYSAEYAVQSEPDAIVNWCVPTVASTGMILILVKTIEFISK